MADDALIRQLQHAAIEAPEFAYQYHETIDRLRTLHHREGPIVDRSPLPRAFCSKCPHSWHGTPCPCDCDTSIVPSDA